VSVSYAARANGDGVDHATEGTDFTATSGRLDWADGDASDKQIVVPIAQDSDAPEELEQFAVEISDVQGGAGMGTNVATVNIPSDAPAAGMFSIDPDYTVNEADGRVTVYVSRGYSWTGAVSVKVTPTPDTATAGDDFEGAPLAVNWGDGDFESKAVSIRLTNDSSVEPTERFSLQLTDPTGGAVIGPRSTASVSIEDDDGGSTSGGGGGGGGGGGAGGTGLLPLLVLAIGKWLRARGVANHEHSS